LRPADAGFAEGFASAREHHLNLPMLGA
jgi:hypothetical protein